MNKATIVLTEDGDGQLNIKTEFDPDVDMASPKTNYAAWAAVHMLQLFMEDQE